MPEFRAIIKFSELHICLYDHWPVEMYIMRLVIITSICQRNRDRRESVKITYAWSGICSHIWIVFRWKWVRRERCCLEPGGDWTCVLIDDFSSFSVVEIGVEDNVCDRGGDERDCVVISDWSIGCVFSIEDEETSISSSTSGTANIFLNDSCLIQNDMIVLRQLIL